jgi:predicted nucleic acid-binding protein
MRCGASGRLRHRHTVFVDTSFIVGLADKADQWHGEARRLSKGLPKHPRLTDLVIAESVTIVGKRSGGDPARALYDYFVDECEIIFVDRVLLGSAVAQHTRFDGTLSLADCATVAAMAQKTDRSLVSFDSDFDKVPGITRLH